MAHLLLIFGLKFNARFLNIFFGVLIIRITEFASLRLRVRVGRYTQTIPPKQYGTDPSGSTKPTQLQVQYRKVTQLLVHCILFYTLWVQPEEMELTALRGERSQTTYKRPRMFFRVTMIDLCIYLTDKRSRVTIRKKGLYSAMTLFFHIKNDEEII